MAYQFQFPRSPRSRPLLFALFCLIACFAQAVTVFAVDTLTVYSGRSERLIKPVLDEFTSKTGIQVDLLPEQRNSSIDSRQKAIEPRRIFS